MRTVDCAGVHGVNSYVIQGVSGGFVLASVVRRRGRCGVRGGCLLIMGHRSGAGGSNQVDA